MNIFAAGLLGILMASPVPRAQDVVENLAAPIAKNAGRILNLREVWRITDEGGGFFFKGIWALKVGPDGAVYIFDADQLLKFTSDGKFVANLLKKGQGPGEVGQASQSYHLGFCVKPSRLYLFAFGDRKFIRMTPEGAFVDEFRMTSVRPNRLWGIAGNQLVVTDEGSVRMGMAKTEELINVGVDLLLIAEDGNAEKKILSLTKNVLVGPKFGAEWDPFDAAYDEDGQKLYVIHTCEYKIEEVDVANGKIDKIFGRKYPRIPYVVKDWEKEFRKKVGMSTTKEFENDIADLFINKGNLWARTSTKDIKKGVLFDVFDPTGKYVDCFYVSRGESVIAVQDDFLYMKEQAEDGSLWAVKYRIVEK